MAIISNISKAADLETTHEQTRKGFIQMGLEIKRKHEPFEVAADTFRYFTQQAKTPYDILANQDDAISDIDYVIARKKLMQKLLSIIDMRGVDYKVLLKTDEQEYKWRKMRYADAFYRANYITAITWEHAKVLKVLTFNTMTTKVNNGADISVYDCTDVPLSLEAITKHADHAIMFAELKGGLSPTASSEDWRRSNTTLQRIRTEFAAKGHHVHTSYIAAAIGKTTATEIFEQLRNHQLSYAVNLMCDKQLCDYCNWMIALTKG